MSGSQGVSTRQTVRIDVEGRTRFVSAELRVSWPITATDEEIDLAIDRAVAEARKRVASRRST